jgi:hypothetical protein
MSPSSRTRCIGDRRRFPFAELVAEAYRARVQLSAAGFYKTPKIHWDRAAGKGRPFYYFAYGAACSEVEIDTLTGEYRVLRTDILHDVGRSLNPAIDRGQVEGAFIQGMGWLTTEELWWDKDGRLRTHAPSTYKIPLASDRPRIFNVALADWSENREPTIKRSKAVGEPPFMLGISVFEALSMAVASVADYRECPAPRCAGNAGAGAAGHRAAARGRLSDERSRNPRRLPRPPSRRRAVRVAEVRGSAPRDTDAEMLVAPGAIHGTIGGGQLEYMAIDEARALIARSGARPHGRAARPRDRPVLRRPGGADPDRLDAGRGGAPAAEATARAAARPDVLIFGAGHVGRALAAALLPLPVRAVLIDSRRAELALAPSGVETRLRRSPRRRCARRRRAAPS